MSYELVVPASTPPSWRALRDGIGLPELRALPDEPGGEDWPAGGLRLCRAGLSTRTTDVDWKDGKLTIETLALASPDDFELALRVAETAAELAGAATIHADYFGDIQIGELRTLHPADLMREQAESGTSALVKLVNEGRGTISIPGPNRSCEIGPRLLAELEAAGPPETLVERVLATMRRVQWHVPAGFRDAGVFASGGNGNGNGNGDGEGARQTRFAVWIGEENLVLPHVDYVALRVTDGEIVIVPFAEITRLAGAHATLLDESQLLVRAMGGDEWQAVVARARLVAKSPPKK